MERLLTYILFDITVMVIILGLCVIYYKNLLRFFNGFGDSLRKFIYKNDSFFTISFLFIFFLNN